MAENKKKDNEGYLVTLLEACSSFMTDDTKNEMKKKALDLLKNGEEGLEAISKELDKMARSNKETSEKAIQDMQKQLEAFKKNVREQTKEKAEIIAATLNQVITYLKTANIPAQTKQSLARRGEQIRERIRTHSEALSAELMDEIRAFAQEAIKVSENASDDFKTASHKLENDSQK